MRPSPTVALRMQAFSAVRGARSLGGLPWQYATYLAGLAVSKFGDALYAFTLPWLAYELTHSPLVMGTLYGAQVLPTLLFGSLIGVLVDRWDRRRLLLGADILRAAIVGLVALIYMLGLLQMVYLYAAAFALALISLAFDVTTTVVIPELVGGERQLVRANAAREAVTQASSIVGPAMAGLILAAAGAALALWIDAVSFAGTFLAVLALPAFGATAHRRKLGGVVSGIVEAAAWLCRCPPLRALSIQAMAGNIGFGMANAVLLFYLRDTRGLTTDEAGLDFAFLEVGGLLGTLAIVPLEHRFRRGWLYSGIIVWGILGLITIVTVHSWWGPGIGMAMLISCNLAWAVLSTSVRQELIPPELRGRVVSLGRVLSSASLPFGAMLGGLLAQTFDPTLVFVVAIGTYSIELLISRCSALRRL